MKKKILIFSAGAAGREVFQLILSINKFGIIFYKILLHKIIHHIYYKCITCITNTSHLSQIRHIYHNYITFITNTSQLSQHTSHLSQIHYIFTMRNLPFLRFFFVQTSAVIFRVFFFVYTCLVSEQTIFVDFVFLF